jgi:two-component system, sensor histidine kinase and response regulator
MKLLRQKSFGFYDRLKSVSWRIIEPVHFKPSTSLKIPLLQLFHKIKSVGFNPAMDDFEKRELSVFNQLNFFQLVIGIIIPIAGLVNNHQLPALAWLVACTPALVSVLVLWLNDRQLQHIALIAYFVLYPFATSIVYLSGMNLGVELSFILYGILSVFFIADISQMLFVLGLSMVSYFVLAVVCKDYRYQLERANLFFYFFNQLMSIVFIFYGLFLIKKENTDYQLSILEQKEKIAENGKLLERQTEELTDLNALKNKLFSVISHDLKAPMYALRNLFRNMQQYDLPANEIKAMVPEVVNELTYTTSLMENLLQWARSQMQSDAVHPQLIDISVLMDEVTKLLRLQAEAKRIKIGVDPEPSTCVFADKDMIDLVLRNFLSNAIKFTPANGTISLGARRSGSAIEVYVQDTGEGISPDALARINLNNYYSTKGTAGESGTGLGLLLCKEFLARNGGKMHIESESGKGSIFSFTLPAAE